MSEESYDLAKRVYEYIRVKGGEKESLDQIDLAYISGLLEGLLIKNGYGGAAEESDEPKKSLTDKLLGR